MDKKEFIEVKDKLSLMMETKDILDFFNPSNHDLWTKTAIIGRLFELQGYEEIIKILNNKYNEYSEDHDILKYFLMTIQNNGANLSSPNFLESIIHFLLSVAKACTFQYERFLVCKTISFLAIQNKFLPSKNLTILYFSIILDLFKESNHLLAYLNALSILNEISNIKTSSVELEELKLCAGIKNEKFPRDLFCGIKETSIDSISIKDSDTRANILSEKWKFILEIVKNDLSVDFNDENSEMISFIIKNEIPFKIEHNKVKIIKKPYEGFTTRIFDIIRNYEPVITTAPIQEEFVTPNPIKQESTTNLIKPKTAPKEPISKPFVFANRFSKPYKIHKITAKYAPVHFEDPFYSTRNSLKEQNFKLSNNLFEEEKSLLINNKDKIENLYSALNRLITEKQVKQKLENDERRRREQEARDQEEKAKKWFNQPKKPVGQSSISLFTPRTQYPKNDSSNMPSNLYVPKMTTYDLSSISDSLPETSQVVEKNPSSENIYVPKHTTSSLTYSTDFLGNPNQDSSHSSSVLYTYKKPASNFKNIPDEKTSTDSSNAKSTPWRRSDSSSKSASQFEKKF